MDIPTIIKELEERHQKAKVDAQIRNLEKQRKLEQNRLKKLKEIGEEEEEAEGEGEEGGGEEEETIDKRAENSSINFRHLTDLP